MSSYQLALVVSFVRFVACFVQNLSCGFVLRTLDLMVSHLVHSLVGCFVRIWADTPVQLDQALAPLWPLTCFGHLEAPKNKSLRAQIAVLVLFSFWLNAVHMILNYSAKKRR